MTKLYYHATDKVFDRFDPAFQGSKGATNGYLGVWVGNEISDCDMFGDVLMTLSIPEIVPYPLRYRELRDMNDQTRGMDEHEAADFYREFVRELMAEGYTVIDIVTQRNCLPSHSIVMDPASIVIESSEVMDKREPSVWGSRGLVPG
jgi:hypothetical protein